MLTPTEHTQLRSRIDKYHTTMGQLYPNRCSFTPEMMANIIQTAGIDLPLKALAWQDAAGKTWLSWNEPAWLAARHGLAGQGGAVAKALSGAIAALAQEATTKA